MKNSVKLNESQLRKIVTESIKKVLSQQFPVNPNELARMLYTSNMDIEEFIHRFEDEWEMLKADNNNGKTNPIYNLPPLAAAIRNASTFKTFRPEEEGIIDDAEIVDCGWSRLSEYITIAGINTTYGVGYELDSNGNIEYFIKADGSRFHNRNIYLNKSKFEDYEEKQIMSLLV